MLYSLFHIVRRPIHAFLLSAAVPSGYGEKVSQPGLPGAHACRNLPHPGRALPLLAVYNFQPALFLFILLIILPGLLPLFLLLSLIFAVISGIEAGFSPGHLQNGSAYLIQQLTIMTDT